MARRILITLSVMAFTAIGFFVTMTTDIGVNTSQRPTTTRAQEQLSSPTIKQRSSTTVPPATTQTPQDSSEQATSITTTGQSPNPETSWDSAEQTDLAQRAGKVRFILNQHRAGVGCGLVTNDARLVAAATGHAQDMADNGFFDHKSLDGSSVGDRVKKQNYIFSVVGENIALGQRTAQEVMDAWIASPGHRENIENCDYEDIGIAAVRGQQGVYWVQVFGAQF